MMAIVQPNAENLDRGQRGEQLGYPGAPARGTQPAEEVALKEFSGCGVGCVSVMDSTSVIEKADDFHVFFGSIGWAKMAVRNAESGPMGVHPPDD
jgi:hypothetical protein